MRLSLRKTRNNHDIKQRHAGTGNIVQGPKQDFNSLIRREYQSHSSY